MMLVSAPSSILHKARVCFPSGLSARQTFKRAFSLQETTWTLLAKGVALIGPRNMWSQDGWLGSGTDSLAPALVHVASMSCTFFFF